MTARERFEVEKPTPKVSSTGFRIQDVDELKATWTAAKRYSLPDGGLPEKVNEWLQSEELAEDVAKFLRNRRRYEEISEQMAERSQRMKELRAEIEELDPVSDDLERARLQDVLEQHKAEYQRMAHNRGIFKTNANDLLPEWLVQVRKAAEAYRELADVLLRRLGGAEQALAQAQEYLDAEGIGLELIEEIE